MKRFTEETIVERNENGFISTMLGNDIVLMNTTTGDYIGMNTVGTDIWQLLKNPLSINTVIEKIINMYEIDEQVGKEKLNSFIQVMLDNKVIFIKSPDFNSVC